MVDIQRSLELAREGLSDSGESVQEHLAPNGRAAFMIDGKWVGYSLAEGGLNGRGCDYGFYEVCFIKGQIIQARYLGRLTPAERRIVMKKRFGGRTLHNFDIPGLINGRRCSLLTL